MNLKFKTIDLDTNLATCINFRRDSYYVSFSTLDGYKADMQNYESRMSERIAYLPEGNCHVWLEEKIIGQTEMKLINNKEVGYVSLFYLKPDYRAQGLGHLLHKHALSVFATLGKKQIQLSVSKTNQHAISFYNKNGWENLGPHPDKNMMYLMSYAI